MKKISFKNSKEKELAGILHIPKEPTDSIIIIAHGFTSNKDRERLIKIAGTYAENGLAALRFDFGGSGESYETEINIENQVDDLKSAIKFVKGKGYNKIGLQGESLGGLISLLVYPAYNEEIKTMVLWAPVTKGKDKLKEVLIQERLSEKDLEKKGYIIKKKDNREFKISKKYFEERQSINRTKILSKIKCPVLILHGDEDETIPLSDSKEALQYLKDAQLEIIKGGDHKLDEKINIVFPLSLNWFKENL